MIPFWRENDKKADGKTGYFSRRKGGAKMSAGAVEKIAGARIIVI